MRALEKFCEAIVTNGQGNTEPNGRPEGVASAHPIPEGEHICGIDAEFLYSGLVRGKRNEMFCDVLLVIRLLHKPRTRRVSVGQSLLGRESF